VTRSEAQHLVSLLCVAILCDPAEVPVLESFKLDELEQCEKALRHVKQIRAADRVALVLKKRQATLARMAEEINEQRRKSAERKT
jgi:hypothetical protein